MKEEKTEIFERIRAGGNRIEMLGKWKVGGGDGKVP